MKFKVGQVVRIIGNKDPQHKHEVQWMTINLYNKIRHRSYMIDETWNHIGTNLYRIDGMWWPECNLQLALRPNTKPEWL